MDQLPMKLFRERSKLARINIPFHSLEARTQTQQSPQMCLSQLGRIVWGCEACAARIIP